MAAARTFTMDNLSSLMSSRALEQVCMEVMSCHLQTRTYGQLWSVTATQFITEGIGISDSSNPFMPWEDATGKPTLLSVPLLAV